MKKFTKFLTLILVVTCIGLLVSCVKTDVASQKSTNKASSVLVVEILDEHEMPDLTQIELGLKKGGLIKLNTEGAEAIDPDFEEKYANIDSDMKYRIAPALLNFVAAQGWQFQQKFCINMNSDNAEYYFIR